MNLDSIISQIKSYDPEKIILFGSWAYGNPNKDSDLDLAIIKDTDEPFHERLIEVRRLIHTDQPIDLFVFTNEEIRTAKVKNPFVAEIVEKGRVVYEQQ